MSPLLCTEMLMGKDGGALRNVNDRKPVWTWCEALFPERAETSTCSFAILGRLG
jgi:hypothetical protein